MAHKYLEDLGIPFEKIPEGWNLDDSRQEKWKKEKEIYGFDERDTWSLDYGLKLWLYERLSMYNEINRIDTSYHKFEYKGKMLTEQDCIDKMLTGLKYSLLYDWYEDEYEKHKEEIDDIFPILAICHYVLWW